MRPWPVAAVATFQSTSPVRGTTYVSKYMLSNTGISIHVPREGDDKLGKKYLTNPSISIHVPREGDDANGTRTNLTHDDFNPRPP